MTGAGAPSYTSGVHMWNGTTASLKPTPTSSITMPMVTTTSPPPRPAISLPTPPADIVPDSAYTSAMPKMRNAEVAPASTRYFTAASTASSRCTA